MGKSSIKNTEKALHVFNFMKECLNIKAEEGADCILIGGDFNLGIEHVGRLLDRVNLLDSVMREEGQQFHVAACTPPKEGDDSVRHWQDTIDYFLYSGDLHVEKPTRVKLSLEALKDDSISYDTSEGDKYQKLQQYLDHDPIMTTVYEQP